MIYIPIELLRNIFSHLPLNDLKSVRYVSRLWNLASSQVQFPPTSAVTFDENYQLTEFMTTMEMSPSYQPCPYRTFIIDIERTEDEGKIIFFKFLEVFGRSVTHYNLQMRSSDSVQARTRLLLDAAKKSLIDLELLAKPPLFPGLHTMEIPSKIDLYFPYLRFLSIELDGGWECDLYEEILINTPSLQRLLITRADVLVKEPYPPKYTQVFKACKSLTNVKILLQLNDPKIQMFCKLYEIGNTFNSLSLLIQIRMVTEYFLNLYNWMHSQLDCLKTLNILFTDDWWWMNSYVNAAVQPVPVIENLIQIPPLVKLEVLILERRGVLMMYSESLQPLKPSFYPNLTTIECFTEDECAVRLFRDGPFTTVKKLVLNDSFQHNGPFIELKQFPNVKILHILYPRVQTLSSIANDLTQLEQLTLGFTEKQGKIFEKNTKKFTDVILQKMISNRMLGYRFLMGKWVRTGQKFKKSFLNTFKSVLVQPPEETEVEDIVKKMTNLKNLTLYVCNASMLRGILYMSLTRKLQSLDTLKLVTSYSTENEPHQFLDFLQKYHKQVIIVKGTAVDIHPNNIPRWYQYAPFY